MKIWQFLLVGIFLLMIFYSVNARLIEKRSIQSRVLEDILSVSSFLITDKMEKDLEELQEEGRTPYVWPEEININNGITSYDVNGMAVYHMNESGSFPQKILYLHGGAYVFDLGKNHIQFLDKLASDLNTSIHIPIYPLAPELSYRECYEKVFALYEKMLATTSSEDIILMGDSAGGGLALGLGLLIKERGLPQPGELILLSPWLDITLSNPLITEALDKKDKLLSPAFLIKTGKLWAAGDNPASYLLSPINGNLKGLAPVTIFIGTYELFFPDAQKLHNKLQTVGTKSQLKIYDKMQHVFPLFPTPEAKKATGEIIDIIRDNEK